MNCNQALATVALLIFYMIYLTSAARYGPKKNVPNWKKQACEVPASQNEQSHYTCDDNGDVKCLPGKSKFNVFLIETYFFLYRFVCVSIFIPLEFEYVLFTE